MPDEKTAEDLFSRDYRMLMPDRMLLLPDKEDVVLLEFNDIRRQALLYFILKENSSFKGPNSDNSVS